MLEKYFFTFGEFRIDVIDLRILFCYLCLTNWIIISPITWTTNIFKYSVFENKFKNYFPCQIFFFFFYAKDDDTKWINSVTLSRSARQRKEMIHGSLYHFAFLIIVSHKSSLLLKKWNVSRYMEREGGVKKWEQLFDSAEMLLRAVIVNKRKFSSPFQNSN